MKIFIYPTEAQATQYRDAQDAVLRQQAIDAGYEVDAQGIIAKDITGRSRPDAQRTTTYSEVHPHKDNDGRYYFISAGITDFDAGDGVYDADYTEPLPEDLL